MKDAAFFEFTDRLTQSLVGDEVLLCNLDGEDSDFVRLNGNRVRQAGGLCAWNLRLDLIQGRRQAQAHCDLSGDLDEDLARARGLIERLRERLPTIPDDPFLNYSIEPSASHRVLDGGGAGAEGHGAVDAWDSTAVIADLSRAAEGLDLVGIWASGELSAGFASSLGHRHWHASRSFNLDFSCYLKGDKAVKANLSGLAWDPQALAAKLAGVRRDLEILARPARAILPGRYRAYLAPAAVMEILDLLAWGGFGLKDHQTAQTPLLRLVRGERHLDPRITLREEHARGLAPRFTAEGFVTPEAVTLIANRGFQDCLVDSRSAKEYGQAVNAAGESPAALALDPGDIASAAIPSRLDTGLAISNLWYLNYADRNDCRITGMTRFATFWVENGEPVAPVTPMRFDDSLYHLLGDRLEGLTSEREFLVSAETYEGRSSASALLPGILVSGIELAL
ncbi:MAG: metallopeptidase TldD-related protein [Chromatiaceae bacterium]